RGEASGKPPPQLQRISRCRGARARCRRRRAWVPDPPASPVPRDPPGGARTVLRLRPATLELAHTRPRSSTRTHPLRPVLDARVPGFARAVQGKLATRGACAPLDCTATPWRRALASLSMSGFSRRCIRALGLSCPTCQPLPECPPGPSEPELDRDRECHVHERRRL